MPDYAGLKAEIALPKYAGMDDPTIAADLEATISMPVDVPVGSVEGYMRSRMLLGGMQRFVAAPPIGAPAALIEGLTELLGMVLSPHVSAVAMTDPTVNAAVNAVLGAAVSVGLMSAQNEADLLAMGVVSTTRAQQLGMTPDVHDVEQEMLAARIWPGVSV